MSPVPKSSDASSSVKPKARDAFAQADSEFEAVLQDVGKLEGQGGLDSQARARIDERLQSISKKLNSDLADQVSQISSDDVRPKRRTLPRQLLVPYIAVLTFVIGGPLLESTVGEAFIFSGSTQYRLAMPWLFGILIPILALKWFLIERVTHQLQTSYRYWSDRIFMFLGMVALTSALVVVSPLGWAALLGKTIGSLSRVEVAIISVDSPSRYRLVCAQRAHLEFNSATAQICLDGRLVGPLPSIGEKMMVVGRVSRLGLYIDRLEHQLASQ